MVGREQVGSQLLYGLHIRVTPQLGAEQSALIDGQRQLLAPLGNRCQLGQAQLTCNLRCIQLQLFVVAADDEL